MREIEFRGKSKVTKKWVYGSHLYLNTYDYDCFGSPSKMKKEAHFIVGANDLNFAVDPETVGQYTGLKDNTKWESLTDSEKKEFFNENCSEDGVRIKYPNIDAVKHLWNGKKIYEGDICEDARGFQFVVEWDKDARFLGRGIGRQKEYIRYVGQEPAVMVIGNIHDKEDTNEET